MAMVLYVSIVMESPHPPITMVLYRFILMDNGVISVMTHTMINMKLMSSVINWDILELQVTLELD